MASKPPINQGEVAITLDGEGVTLRCTLLAAKTVNAMLDGFVGAFRRLNQFDLDAFSVIIAAGLGKKTATEMEEVTEKVYRTGMDDLSGPLTKFTSMLSNGGRDPAAKTEAKKDAPEGNG